MLQIWIGVKKKICLGPSSRCRSDTVVCGESLSQTNGLLCSQWSFSADMVVLDPGERYQVSVFNIPKPELGHSVYDVSADVSAPGEFELETGASLLGLSK